MATSFHHNAIVRTNRGKVFMSKFCVTIIVDIKNVCRYIFVNVLQVASLSHSDTLKKVLMIVVINY